MPEKPESDADFLFRSAPSEIQKLHADAKKLLREVKRAEWWQQNGKNRPKPNDTTES